jgi:hypothetical protein
MTQPATPDFVARVRAGQKNLCALMQQTIMAVTGKGEKA